MIFFFLNFLCYKDHNKTMCLAGLLNNCKTTQGSRLLKTFLKQPLKNVEEIGNLSLCIIY